VRAAKIRDQLIEVNPRARVIEKPGSVERPGRDAACFLSVNPSQIATQRRKQRRASLADDLLLCQSEQRRDTDSWVVLERQLLRLLTG